MSDTMTTDQIVFIQRIEQMDHHTFFIEWTDGRAQSFRLNHLQKQCPCANCVDETTGRRIALAESIKEDVSATRVQNVGRYAIRIDFTSGCSLGIYPFTLLRELGQEQI